MSQNAGVLDLEKPGMNRDTVSAFTYNGDGTLATEVVTYNDGTTTYTYTQTYSYTSGKLTGVSKWVKS